MADSYGELSNGRPAGDPKGLSNQYERILVSLRKAEPRLVHNFDIWKICQVLNSRAVDLRQGEREVRVKREPDGTSGCFRYFLGAPPPPLPPNADALPLFAGVDG